MILVIVCVWTYIFFNHVTNSSSLLSTNHHMTSFGKAKVSSPNDLVIPPWTIRERIPVPSMSSQQYVSEEENILETDDDNINVNDLVEDNVCRIQRADDDFIKTGVSLRSCDAARKRNDILPTLEWIPPSSSTKIKTSIIVLVLEFISREDFDTHMPNSANAFRSGGNHFDFEKFHAVSVPIDEETSAEETWPKDSTWNRVHNTFASSGFSTIRNHKRLNRNDAEHCDTNGQWIGHEKLKRILDAVSSSTQEHPFFVMQRLGHLNTIGADDTLASFLRIILSQKHDALITLVSSSGDTFDRNWKRTSFFQNLFF